MRAVVQLVRQANVHTDGQLLSEIQSGLLVLLGVGTEDGQADLDYICDKLIHMRIFPDEQGKMNLSIQDVGGQILLVSQFTLFGDCRKGRRPDYMQASPPALAEELYLRLAEMLRVQGLDVHLGKFRVHMEVSLLNDGPVTILLDSGRLF